MTKLGCRCLPRRRDWRSLPPGHERGRGRRVPPADRPRAYAWSTGRSTSPSRSAWSSAGWSRSGASWRSSSRCRHFAGGRGHRPLPRTRDASTGVSCTSPRFGGSSRSSPTGLSSPSCYFTWPRLPSSSNGSSPAHRHGGPTGWGLRVRVSHGIELRRGRPAAAHRLAATAAFRTPPRFSPPLGSPVRPRLRRQRGR